MKSVPVIQSEVEDKLDFAEDVKLLMRGDPMLLMRTAVYIGRLYEAPNKMEMQKAVDALAVHIVVMCCIYTIRVPFGADRPLNPPDLTLDPAVGLVVTHGHHCSELLNRKLSAEGMRVLLFQYVNYLDKYIRTNMPHDNWITVLNTAWVNDTAFKNL